MKLAFAMRTWRDWHDTEEPIRLGVSSCLLGQEVRFDGGHSRDRFVTDTLGAWVEWVPVCPEVEIGMGTPRPTIRLVDTDENGVRLVAPKTGEDFTERMSDFADPRIDKLEEIGLDGYVLKKSSPSCGLERISIYRENGMKKSRNSRGLFAARLIERWPDFPVEEDGRLNDPHLRESFIERIFCRNRWRTLVRRGLSRSSLVDFHTAHKLLLRAHNEEGYRKLGALVGSAGTIPDAQLFAEYEREFQSCMAQKANVKRHVNVMQHAMGYLKRLLEPREKEDLMTAIEDYRHGMLPLIVPLTLLRFNVKKFEIEYLGEQLYFDPHPKELMLRNHA